MKYPNIRYSRTLPALLIALALGCFSPSPVQADDGNTIVGLWRVHYFHGTDELFQTFDQWHSDGQEFEVAQFAPGAMCQGTWREMPRNGVKLFHVGWNFDETGHLVGYFEETQLNTVSHNTYQGTFDIKNYDTAGNFLSEDTGTLTATRLSVH